MESTPGPDGDHQRADAARDRSIYTAYERIAAYPLFFLSVLFLAAFAVVIDPNSSAGDQRIARTIMGLTWLVFAIDYVTSLSLSAHKLHYMRSHVLQGAALLIPPLRVLLVGHAVRVLSQTPARSGARARTYLLYLTTLLLGTSSMLVVYFERSNPDANIKSVGNGLWWAAETVSTVGYGDYYPVTIGGRLVAATLFVNGVALLSIITAGLAQNFMANRLGAVGQADGSAATGGQSGAAGAPDGVGAASFGPAGPNVVPGAIGHHHAAAKVATAGARAAAAARATGPAASPSAPGSSASTPSAPDDTAPDPSAPGPTASDLTEPGPSEPGSTAPSSTAPGTSVLGSAASDSSAPGPTAHPEVLQLRQQVTDLQQSLDQLVARLDGGAFVSDVGANLEGSSERERHVGD